LCPQIAIASSFDIAQSPSFGLISPMPKKITKDLTEKFRLSIQEKTALRRAAKQAGISVSAYIRKALAKSRHN